MQPVSSDLVDAINAESQHVDSRVIATWGTSKDLVDYHIFCSSDYYSRVTELVHSPSLYWKFFDGTPSDSSGNNNHGIVHLTSGALGVNAPLINGPDLQANNKATLFPSNNDSAKVYIRSTDTVDLNSDFCVEFWMQPSVVDSTNRTIVASNNQFAVYIKSTNKLAFKVWVGASTFEVVTSATITASVVYHVVAEFYNGKIQLWLNATGANTSVSGSVNASTSPIYVATDVTTTNYYCGVLDELAIYPRAIMQSDSQAILARYDSGAFIGTSPFSSVYLHNPYEVYNNRTGVAFPWAILNSVDGNGEPITANGEYHIVPVGPDMGDFNNKDIPLFDADLSYGWLTRQITDSSGLFGFAERNVILFDQQYITDIQIAISPYQNKVLGYSVYYKEALTGNWILLINTSFAPDEYIHTHSVGVSPILVSGVKVEINSTMQIEIPAFVQSIDILYKEDISDDIISMTITKTKETFDSDVPLGSTSANTFDLTLQNIDKKYSPYNINSPVYQYINPGVKFEVELGWKLEDTTIEYISQGTYYTDEWQLNSADMTATMKGRDKSKLLMDKIVPQSGFYCPSVWAGDAIADMAKFVGVPKIDIDYVKTYEDTVFSKKPLAFWRLNEEGPQNTIMNFTGTSYCIVPLVINLPTEFVNIDFWAKSSYTAAVQSVFQYGRNTADDIAIQFNNTDVLFKLRGTSLTVSSANPNDGKWHHWRFQWRNSDDAVTIYKDGKVISTTTLSPSALSQGGTVTVGARQTPIGTASGNFFHGNIAEVRWWNAYFTDQRIPSRTAYGEEADLYAAWPMNEGGGVRGGNLVTGWNNLTYTNVEWSQEYLMTGVDLGGATNNVTWVVPPIGWDTDGPIISNNVGNSNYTPVFDINTYGLSVLDSNEFVLGSTITWEFWANPLSLSGDKVLITKDYVGASTSGTWQIILTSSGSISLYNNANNAVTSTGSLALDEDTHVVITYDTAASPKVKIYLNGVLSGSGSITNLTTNVCPIIIGQSGSSAASVLWSSFGSVAWSTFGSSKWKDIAGGSTTIDGSLSNIAIYDTVLSADQVEENYKAARNPNSREFDDGNHSLGHFRQGAFWAQASDANSSSDIWSSVLEIAMADLGMVFFKDDNSFIYETMDQYYSPIFPEHSEAQYVFSDIEDTVSTMSGNQIYNFGGNINNIIDMNEQISIQANRVIISVTPMNTEASPFTRIWEAPSDTTLATVTLAADLSYSDTTSLNVEYTPIPFNIDGYLKIDDEVIGYETYSGGKFNKLTRGLFGTTPVAHTSGTNVFETRKYDILFTDAPELSVKDPFITAVDFDKRARIEKWTYNNFAATLIVSSTATDGEVTVLNGTNPLTGADNFMVIDGIPVQHGSSSSVTVQSSASLDNFIKKYGVKEIRIANKYIKDTQTAKKIADFLISAFKNPLSIITLDVLAVPQLQLGDRVNLLNLNQLGIDESVNPLGLDFFLLGTTLTYDGGVKQSVNLRRVS